MLFVLTIVYVHVHCRGATGSCTVPRWDSQAVSRRHHLYYDMITPLSASWSWLCKVTIQDKYKVPPSHDPMCYCYCYWDTCWVSSLVLTPISGALHLRQGDRIQLASANIIVLKCRHSNQGCFGDHAGIISRYYN